MPNRMNLQQPARPLLFIFLLILGGAAFAHGEKIHEVEVAEPIVLAPGYETLDYPAPVPGTYTLGNLGPAGDGEVLDIAGKARRLHDVLENKITVLSFIYRACNDVNGCPLATFVMNRLRQNLANDASLKGRVQLVSMSFDPTHDTPQSMAEYAASFGEGSIEWTFLTSASDTAVRKILSSYDQSIRREVSDDDANVISHLLRVYVIDEHKTIRNIFNSSLLHADTLISDIKTLALQSEIRQQPGQHAAPATIPASEQSSSAGAVLADDRTGYATGEYVSRSTRLQTPGQAADLLALARKAQPGLPPVPGIDVITEAQVALGRQLFFDRRLSLNNTFSCAMCHLPEQAFTVNDLATAVGMEGRTGRRNAPTIINVGYMDKLFHDGREYSLEQQVWSPLLAHNEMANPSIGYVISKIAALKDYRQAFELAFGTEIPDMHSIGAALAAYQRVLVAGNSAFDQWHYSGDEAAVEPSVKLGWELFTGKAGCANCHRIGERTALFTDNQLHNTGIGYARSMRSKTEPHPVTLAPGVVIMVDPSVYADSAEEPRNDLGLYEITQDPADRWKFRTPGLRNVALTAPYMHNGSLGSLAEVIDFYSAGGVDNPVLSPLIKPFALTPEERSALVDFLSSLTGAAVSVLISDAQAAPVGDVDDSDPD